MADLNYKHLRYFWAVAHDGNLTRTAERLNLSQSALSVQIRRLEERLGHALFERRGRQLQLTEAGRIALDHADAIFAAGDELVGTLRGTNEGVGVVRVGALATLSRNFQLAFLGPLLAREDVELTLRSGTAASLLEALTALNLDVVLINRPPAREAGAPFVSHRLADQTVSLVGTPALADAGDDLSMLLARHPMVLPPRDSSVRAGFDGLCARLGVRPRVAAEVDDMAMMRLLAREGVGLAVLPPIAAKDELETGHLKEIAALPGVAEAFFAVTLERKFPNPLVAALLEGAGDAL